MLCSFVFPIILGNTIWPSPHLLILGSLCIPLELRPMHENNFQGNNKGSTGVPYFLEGILGIFKAGGACGPPDPPCSFRGGASPPHTPPYCRPSASLIRGGAKAFGLQVDQAHSAQGWEGTFSKETGSRLKMRKHADRPRKRNFGADLSG